MIHRVEAEPVITAKPRVHLDYLDGVRALAALYVCAFHILSYHHSQLTSKSKFYLHWLWFGHDAVDVFIVLSGFCLMLPVARNQNILKGGALTFFRRRARRILPPYYFALGLILLLDVTLISRKTGTPWDMSVPVTFKGLIAHLFLVQDAFQSTWAQINCPMWSISVEWRIYFCFPLIVFLWRRWSPWYTICLAAVISFLLVHAFESIYPLNRFNVQNNGIMPQYLLLFSLGVLGAGICFGAESSMVYLRTKAPWGLLLFTSFIAVLLAAHKWHQYDNPKLDNFVGGCTMIMLIYAAQGNNLVRRALSLRPLVWMGTFAYSIYLLHFPIVQMVWQFIINPLQLSPDKALVLHWLIAIPLSVSIAYVFHIFFEKPYMTQKKNETPAEIARDAALSPAP